MRANFVDSIIALRTLMRKNWVEPDKVKITIELGNVTEFGNFICALKQEMPPHCFPNGEVNWEKFKMMGISFEIKPAKCECCRRTL